MKSAFLILLTMLCCGLAFGSVVISHFEAVPDSHQVSFTWGTSSEDNNLFFEVWRNDTARVQITGHGTSTQPHEYSWVDTAPIQEHLNHYKLMCASSSQRDSVAGVVVNPPHWVALGSFTAHASGTALVQLNWLVLSEINNVRFEIFRNHIYQTSVVGHGNNNVPHNYSWLDTAVTAGGQYDYLLTAISISSQYDSLAHTQITLAAGEPRVAQPADYHFAAYPNPFNPATTLSFVLPATQRAKVTICDILGQEVRTLADDVFIAGEHQLAFDASTMPSGLYFAVLQGNGFKVSQKLLLLK